MGYDNSNENWAFETRQVHAGQPVDSDTGARALPLYQTTSFVFDSAEQAADRFALRELGPIYTRITNPTQEAVENRIASLEGGVAALLFASGQAAETAAIQSIVQAGGHVVASPRLYGGTETLLRHTLPKYGITATFVEDPDDPRSWEAAVQPNTRLFYGESISNPLNDILDIPAIAHVAHEHQVPLVVDNTVASPYLIRPIELGADVVVESATKYLGGHGTSLAGVLVDGGKFDWRAQRDGEDLFPSFTQPDPAYHGAVYADLGAPALALKARVTLLRDTGAAVSPFNAWTLQQGLETLSLRVERHNSNALAVAEFLESRNDVADVRYAGLESSKWHGTQKEISPKGAGAIVTFDLAVPEGTSADETTAKAWAFIDALKLHSCLVNIGDTKSLVCHPATTTHSQLTEEALLRTGVTQASIRLSVGIESVEDILADLELGFATL
ncbi:O-acetylhomoserine aminocarboxypropyltransferase/cysteine synthase family protein [Dietzia sp.]|uniref:O-acetylhomoserine aminocarboxypropyltransferase/cysteine synthase family protein n=1 Tax=Dietzia sp. TaxID=1871616 RepID=UPI002FDB8AD3